MKAMWDPFQEMDDLLSTFDRSFGSRALPGPKGDATGLSLRDWTPAVDISETDEEYLITFELPDVSRDDIKVSIEDGILTVTGERKVEKEDKKKKFHRVERFYGSFSRSFNLPEDVDTEGIHAGYADGVLNLSLKKTERPAPTSVAIEVE